MGGTGPLVPSHYAVRQHSYLCTIFDEKRNLFTAAIDATASGRPLATRRVEGGVRMRSVAGEFVEGVAVSTVGHLTDIRKTHGGRPLRQGARLLCDRVARTFEILNGGLLRTPRRWDGRALLTARNASGGWCRRWRSDHRVSRRHQRRTHECGGARIKITLVAVAVVVVVVGGRWRLRGSSVRARRIRVR